MATLYIVATPIGNLKDIAPRALETFRGVDLILCEDTRVTQKLLTHYGIEKSLMSYHQHSKLQKTDYIVNLLREGKDLALVSDAGTPGISDPGNKLIESVVSELQDKAKIVVIPGPSAITAAASISGFSMDSFLFLGFPPAKNKRKKFFKEVMGAKYPVIFYESPHRILKTLNELILSDAKMVVCREMTKKFETVYRGTAKEVIEKIKKDVLKGEFVVIVNNLEKQ